MNHVRPAAKLAPCSGSAGAMLARAPVPSSVTQRYRICALCNIDHGNDIERLMRRELRAPAICVEQIGPESHLSRHLVRVVAVVSCAARARSVLFRLVNRLGLDAAVRSICWEPAPSARPRAAVHRFDAPAPQTHSATKRTPNGVAGASQ